MTGAERQPPVWSGARIRCTTPSPRVPRYRSARQATRCWSPSRRHVPALRRFNPHSAPPPERRFSPTGSFAYRPREARMAPVGRGAPRPPGKRLSSLCGAPHKADDLSVVSRLERLLYFVTCLSARRGTNISF